MAHQRRPAIVAAAFFVSLAALALIGGLLAQFHSAPSRPLPSNMPALALQEGNRWTMDGVLLATQDKVARDVTVENTGRVAIRGVELSSHLSRQNGDLPSVVYVTVLEGKTVVVPRRKLSQFGHPWIVFPDVVAPSSSRKLSFVYELAEPSDPARANSLQGERVSVRYTFETVRAY